MTRPFGPVGRNVLWASALLLCAACESTPADRHMRTQIEQLDGTIEQLEGKNKQLTQARSELSRRVDELEAELEKTERAEVVAEKVTDELEEKVRMLIERFQGDKDVLVEASPGGYRFVLRERVLFAPGLAAMTDEGREALRRVAEAVRDQPGHLRIEGHTDDVPIKRAETLKSFPRGNIELSVERALVVWDYLIGEGKIDEGRLSVIGFGATRPRVPNTSELARYKNRRVEIRVAE